MVVIGSANRRLQLFSSHFFPQKLLNQESNPNCTAVGSDLGL